METQRAPRTVIPVSLLARLVAGRRTFALYVALSGAAGLALTALGWGYAALGGAWLAGAAVEACFVHCIVLDADGIWQAVVPRAAFRSAWAQRRGRARLLALWGDVRDWRVDWYHGLPALALDLKNGRVMVVPGGGRGRAVAMIKAGEAALRTYARAR